MTFAKFKEGLGQDGYDEVEGHGFAGCCSGVDWEESKQGKSRCWATLQVAKNAYNEHRKKNGEWLKLGITISLFFNE